MLNADTAQIEDVNPYLIEMLGYTHADFLGKKLWEVAAFADVAQSKEMFSELQKTGYVRYDDLALKTKTGARIRVEIVSNTCECEGIKLIHCNVRNITERKTAEATSQRQTRLFAALSQCHKAIAHCTGEEALFREICRAAVQFGGMKMAWIGITDPASLTVRPAASFGDDTEYLRSVSVSADFDGPFAHGVTGTAIRENRPVWCQDFVNDARTLPWREHAQRAGWAALASLPLHRNGLVIGAITLDSREAHAFDESTRNLLLDMAQDIDFALDNIARESERKRAEEEAQFANAVLRSQQEASLDAILVVDRNSLIISCNQRFIDLWGVPPQLISARLDEPVLRFVVEQVENPDVFLARVQYLNEHHDEKSREELQLKDGRIIDRYSAPVTGADGRYYGRVWYFRDISAHKRAAQELHESERRFSDMLGNVELVSLMLDREARITYCNEYLLRLTGWQRDEVLGQDWFELFIPPELHHLKHSFYPAILAGAPEAMHDENEILTRSGSRRLIRWNSSVLRSAAGGVTGIASIGEDITERREAADRIAYLSRVHAMLSGINALIVRVHDRAELFREACRIAVEAGGFRMSLIAMVDGNEIVPVASSGTDVEFQTTVKSVLSSRERAPGTVVAQAIREKKPVVCNDSANDPRVLFGKKYAEYGVRSFAVLPLIVADEAVSVLALYAGESEFFHAEEMTLLTELSGNIAFAMDHIGKRERLDYLAYYDPLTGLANRRLFLDRVSQYIRSAASTEHKLALYLIDLERFKSFNDTLGQSVGDELLRQVAQWLTIHLGDVNLLARVGADQFAVVCPVLKQEEDLARILEKTMTAFLEHPFQLNGGVFRIAAKVGVALCPEDGADADALFRHAEAALKKAKASGDRYLFYTQKMTEAVAGKLTLENELRHALENEEFVLYYQPKVDLDSGKVTSAEALIRWNDPRTGLVPPARFIPILEETGLIYEVGRWALRKAIEDYLRWRTTGLAAVRIAVNVSPLQLRNRAFVEDIRQLIDIDAHAAAGLELEITENLIMEDVRHNIANLKAIRAMGVTIAIDDFGTGFSSLSYLSKLPVDTLKIDRSFVMEMTAAQDGLAFVSTIISLAHSLKLKVVAEGVETEDQSRLLKSLRCDEMQGFLFSKALPCESFEAQFLAPLSVG